MQLLWHDGKGKDKDRLGSPLIVKPLPVRGKSFLPIALWLNRAEPNGQVFAKQGPNTLPSSQAHIGTFRAPLFEPAHGKSSVREAFCYWLVNVHHWVKLP